jgi:hypothetical protein
VGVEVPPVSAVVTGLVVLAGSAVPLSIAGWGPREGVTSAVFAVVGLGSATGLTVSLAFGVLSAVATVPGALVLLADAALRRRSALTRAGSGPEPMPPRVLEGKRHG